MEPKRKHENLHVEARIELDVGEISEIRSVSELRAALEGSSLSEVEPSYSVTDPLEGDVFSSSSRQRSEHPCAFDSIAFVEGARVLTITWLPPAP